MTSGPHDHATAPVAPAAKAPFRARTAEAVQVHGAWTADRIAAAFIAAVLPPLAGALYLHGVTLLPTLAVALIATLGWQIVFAWSRGSPIGWDGIVTAIAFAILAPPSTPLWQTALALSFGVVAGEQIFGGRGRNFVNPAAVGLALLFFSFPPGAPGEASGLINLASIPGAALLIVLGLVSWRIVAAACVGLAVTAFFTDVADPVVFLNSGNYAFALLFLGCDPVSAAATNGGRYVYGLLIGALAAVLGVGEAAAIVFAVLLASIFAPAIDQAVIRLHALRRRRRHG